CSPADTAKHTAQNLRTPVRSLPAPSAPADRTPDPTPSAAASTLDAREHSADSRTSHPAFDGPCRAISSTPGDQEFLPVSSCTCPFKFALPNSLRAFHLVVRVPAFPSGVLPPHVTPIRPPLLQRLAVFPPHHGEPFAIFRGKTLHRKKAWFGLHVALQ